MQQQQQQQQQQQVRYASVLSNEHSQDRLSSLVWEHYPNSYPISETGVHSIGWRLVINIHDPNGHTYVETALIQRVEMT